MLKLLAEWPAIEVSAQSQSVQSILQKVVVLGYVHNVVLDTAPPSVVKLPVDWPASTNLISVFRQDVRDPNGIQMKRNGIESTEEVDDTIDHFLRQCLSLNEEGFNTYGYV
jgi:hypothetical protein